MAIKTEALSKLLVKLKIAPDEAAAKELITSKDETTSHCQPGITSSLMMSWLPGITATRQRIPRLVPRSLSNS
jgi:hypothetical protein